MCVASQQNSYQPKLAAIWIQKHQIRIIIMILIIITDDQADFTRQCVCFSFVWTFISFAEAWSSFIGGIVEFRRWNDGSKSSFLTDEPPDWSTRLDITRRDRMSRHHFTPPLSYFPGQFSRQLTHHLATIYLTDFLVIYSHHVVFISLLGRAQRDADAPGCLHWHTTRRGGSLFTELPEQLRLHHWIPAAIKVPHCANLFLISIFHPGLRWSIITLLIIEKKKKNPPISKIQHI